MDNNPPPQPVSPAPAPTTSFKSIKKITAIGVLAIVLGVLIAAVSVLALFFVENASMLDILLSVVIDGALGVAYAVFGILLLNAKSVGSVLTWFRALGITVLVNLLLVLVVTVLTKEFGGVGFLPLLIIILINFALRNLVNAGLTTGMNVFTAKAR